MVHDGNLHIFIYIDYIFNLFFYGQLVIFQM